MEVRDAIPPEFWDMTDREIGLRVVAEMFPDDPLPLNYSRADIILRAMGRTPPDDWTFLLSRGKHRDSDFWPLPPAGSWAEIARFGDSSL